MRLVSQLVACLAACSSMSSDASAACWRLPSISRGMDLCEMRSCRTHAQVHSWSWVVLNFATLLAVFIFIHVSQDYFPSTDHIQITCHLFIVLEECCFAAIVIFCGSSTSRWSLLLMFQTLLQCTRTPSLYLYISSPHAIPIPIIDRATHAVSDVTLRPPILILLMLMVGRAGRGFSNQHHPILS